MRQQHERLEELMQERARLTEWLNAANVKNDRSEIEEVERYLNDVNEKIKTLTT